MDGEYANPAQTGSPNGNQTRDPTQLFTDLLCLADLYVVLLINNI